MPSRAAGAATTPLPLPGSIASINFIGDSFTFGVGATTNAQRYSTLAAALLSATEINSGISGTVLQNSLDETNAAKANNGRNRWYSALITGGGVMAVIAYGYNDARYVASPSTLNAANYQATLDRLVVDLLLQGRLPSQILIASPWYITDTGLVTGTSGFSGQTRAGFEAYVAAAAAVAAKYGTYYYDAYAYMQNHGGAALIGPDDIHTNDAGHAVNAAGLLTATRVPATYTLPTPVFMQDSFSGAANAAITSRVGEIGGAWVVQTGAAPGSPSAIDAAGRLWSATAAGIYQAKGLPTSANYYVEASLVWLSTVASDRVQVAGRMDPAANTFYWGGWDGSVNSWRLFKTVAGVSTQLGANVGATFTSGSKMIRLTMAGDQISLSVDGAVVIGPITDAAITTAGFAGVRMATTQSNSTGIHIDTITGVNL
jgi:lysophospholipase L1-like esterase